MEEESLLKALEKQHELVAVIDGAGRLTYAGPKPLVTGLFHETHLGPLFRDCLAEGFREQIQTAIQQARHKGHSAVECWLQNPHRCFAIDMSKCKDGVLLLGHAKKIDNPFRRAMDGGRAEEGLRSVLRHLRHGVILQGPEAEILMSNDAALECLGLSESQFLGSSSFDPRWHVKRPDGTNFPGHQHPVPVAIRTKKPVENVVMSVYRPRTNDYVRLNVSAIPELNDQGQVQHVVCSFTDITAQHRAEQQLRREHALLNQVMESSLSGICVLEPNQRLLFANPAAKKILELSRSASSDRFYDQPLWYAASDQGHALPDARLASAQVAQNGNPIRNVRHVLQSSAGTQKILSVDGAPITNECGQLEYIVLTIVDITEEARAQEERKRLSREMQKLAHLDSLSVLAGGVAHDFNNILVAIRTAEEVIEEALPADHPCHRDLRLLQESTSRATELTQQLLAYSGKGHFVVGRADLSDVVRGITHLLEALAQGTVVRFDLAQDLPDVQVDQTQLRRIMLNLVLNASEAARGQDNPVVEIRTGLLDVNKEMQRALISETGPVEVGQYAYVEVSDSGEGMPEHVMQHIFDPFFTTKESGHGLGLAAVLGVVRGHGGFVQVDSTPGEGTMFCVGFPAADGTRARMQQGPPTDSFRVGTLTGTYLVIDDEPVVLETISRVLTSEGCSVVTAEDGYSGLQKFRKEHQRIRAAIIDLTMPRLRGDSVLAEIRKTHPELPILLMSGYSHETIPEGLGPSAFVAKPFTGAQILAKLRKLLIFQANVKPTA